MCELEVIYDISNQGLKEVPPAILNMPHLKMLYLDKNQITSLPEDIFEKLPNLAWFDLRDNLLTRIPKSIANHKCLENLLLQGNKISRLPNELGFLPKLKVLQLSGNPLDYPPIDVVNRGIDDIMVFLQQEEYKLTGQIQAPSAPLKNTNSTNSSLIDSNPDNRTESGTLKLEILPTVMENNLNQRILNQRQSYLDNKCNRDKVHKVIKSASKTSVHSYFKKVNIYDYIPSQEKINSEQIKAVWLDKMRELIQDQERILQQERSINALKKWRKGTPSKIKINANATLEAPFDTNAVYNSYMSRADPTSAIQQSLAEQRPKLEKPDVEALIQDVMAQLTKARDAVLSTTDPHEKIKNAERELEIIAQMHKKIANLQKMKLI